MTQNTFWQYFRYYYNKIKYMAENQENNIDEVSENITETSDPNNDVIAKLEGELADQKDKFIRLYSEFENYKRRTAKEKLEFSATANKDIMTALLPVIDDMERAAKSIETSTDIQAIKEGLNLVFNKLSKTLESKGLKPIEAQGLEFDSDLHEAITQIPAPTDELKGKIVDVVEKGYSLNDKIIRFAKVVIGL